MSLDSNCVDSMSQNRVQVPCYQDTYQHHIQKQQYLPDTSTSEQPEYDAVSSTSHFDMGLELDRSFVQNDPNMYPMTFGREAYITPAGVGVIEDINKPRAFVRPTVTREFVSSTGEKFVLSHLVPQPTNGRNTANEGIKKRKRTRTAFTDNQIKKLEDEYALNRYLDQPRRQHIAKSLSLFERTVKIWFQNRRMKEKKMIREANEQSGDEDSIRENFQREYYSVPTGAFANTQPTTSYEVPQISNCVTPNNSYGYGMCPPAYSEAVSFYPSNPQHYSVILPNSANINVGYNSYNAFERPVSSVFSTQNESLRAAMSTLNVDDSEDPSNRTIEKHSPQSFLTNEKVTKEVTNKQTADSIISDDEMCKSGFINLDTFLQ